MNEFYIEMKYGGLYNYSEKNFQECLTDLKTIVNHTHTQNVGM